MCFPRPLPPLSFQTRAKLLRIIKERDIRGSQKGNKIHPKTHTNGEEEKVLAKLLVSVRTSNSTTPTLTPISHLYHGLCFPHFLVLRCLLAVVGGLGLASSCRCRLLLCQQADELLLLDLRVVLTVLLHFGIGVEDLLGPGTLLLRRPSCC